MGRVPYLSSESFLIRAVISGNSAFKPQEIESNKQVAFECFGQSKLQHN
jgi:hypothetical protein